MVVSVPFDVKLFLIPGRGHGIEEDVLHFGLVPLGLVLDHGQQVVADALPEPLATLDGLTGLHNRRSFDTRLDEEISRFQRAERSLSLVIIDVDRFRQFNDQFGHPAGDAALQRVARLLEQTARATDFVARLGGEEFAVLMPETDESNAVIAGERFREAIRDAVWPHRQITVSIGAATRSVDIPQEASLVMQADMALYRSKKAGRDLVTHFDEARETVEETVPVVSSWELVGHA